MYSVVNTDADYNGEGNDVDKIELDSKPTHNADKKDQRKYHRQHGQRRVLDTANWQMEEENELTVV